jgi:hypothetical protein
VHKNAVNKPGYCRLFPLSGLVCEPGQLQQIIDAINNKVITTPDPTTIPAGYTYLGQFIDHEITHMRHLTEPPTARQLETASLQQGRHSCFDLDSIYGSGLDDPLVPYRMDGCFYSEFTRDELIYDLPRGAGKKGWEARIADYHNDENFIVAQMQVLFMNAHNRLVAHYRTEITNLEQRFQHVRNELSLMLQAVVVYDFLPRFLDQQVYQQFFAEAGVSSAHGLAGIAPLLSFHPQQAAMPVEFVGAAFRFGHSLVRGSYPLNDDHQLPVGLRALFGLTGKGGLRSLEDGTPGSDLQLYRIDWRYFFELDYPDFANALSLKPKLADQLRDLINEQPGMQDLLWRNLMRGSELGLPSGQQCCEWLLANHPDYCEALGLRALSAEQISHHDLGPVLHDCGLAAQVPLWLYVLMEPAFNDSDHTRLGKLGSVIVAETFRMLLGASVPSLLTLGGSVSAIAQHYPVCGAWLQKRKASEPNFIRHLLHFVQEGIK